MRDDAREEREAVRHRRIGEFLEALDRGLCSQRMPGARLVSLQLRFPTEEEPSTLLIVRVDAEGGPLVGFVGAYGCADAVLAFRKRLQTDHMKWREDRPWSERAKGASEKA